MLNEEMKKLAESTSYLIPLNYISGKIVEYDISSANITMLRKYNKIDDTYYYYLKNLPKINREIEIGNNIRIDSSYKDIIEMGIKEAKKRFFDTNNIKYNSVIRIANDAVYLLNPTNIITDFDDVHFKEKSVSSALLQLDKNLLIFFWYNENGINIDVKGLGDNAMNLHSEYLLSMIANTIYMVERVSIEEALKYVSKFYEDYINLKLEKEYYREFTPWSMYHYKNTGYYLMDVKSIDDIDIGYNLYIIRKLWGILIEKYNIIVQRRK